MQFMDNSMDPFLFEAWLNKTDLSEGSVYSYLKALSLFLQRNPDLTNIDDYNTFLAEFTFKKRCSYFYYMLKKYIQFKFEDDKKQRDILLANLLKPKTFNTIKRERIHLSDEKILDILKSLESDKHRVICLIQHLTGIRAGDVMRLRRDKIFVEEYEGKTVMKMSVIGKGDKRFVPYIHDLDAQLYIRSYMKSSENNPQIYGEYLFLELGHCKSRPGDLSNLFKMVKMNYLWYWLDVKKALQACGIDKQYFATHDFRRCFARKFWEMYKDVFKLQGILNHGAPSTTLRYLKQSGMDNIDHYKEMQS